MRCVVFLGFFVLLKAESNSVKRFCPPALLNRVDSKFLRVRHGSCFHFSITKRKTFTEADRECRKDGGTLALPKTKPLNDFLTDQLFNVYKKNQDVWIGLHYKENETQFVWADNSNLTWHNFAPGNGPDNDWLVSGVADCVTLNPEQDGLWYDHQCDKTNKTTRGNPSKMYICEYTMISSGGEDKDLTGVTSKPIDRFCPPALLNRVDSKFLQVRHGSCFHFSITKRKTFTEADRECRKDGGTLALPKTKPLNDFLTDQLFNVYKKNQDVWIGLHDKVNETQFVWADNSSLTWHNFAPGNGPDNDWLVSGVADCVTLNPEQDGLWYDHQCDKTNKTTRGNPSKMYICEYTMISSGGEDKDLTGDMEESKSVKEACPTRLVNATTLPFLRVWGELCFYFVVNRRRNYVEAVLDCKKDGGTLALPKTKPLNDFLTDQLLNHYYRYEGVWIGLNDIFHETQFVWADNSGLTWHNFAPGNGPDNDWLVSEVADCVTLNPEHDGLWYDHQCDDNFLAWIMGDNPRKTYICQYGLKA